MFGFLRAIAILEQTRQEQSMSRRWTHEFDRKGLAISHVDRNQLAIIGTRFAFSELQEHDVVSQLKSVSESELSDD